MKSIPFYQTKLIGGFWGEKQRIAKEVTLEALYTRYTENHRLEAMKCDWKQQEREGWKAHIYWDYDPAKWIESLAFMLEHGRDEALEARADQMIDIICSNQLENGYYNCHYNIYDTEKRFQERDGHELFCLGHFIEAATAYYHATGKDKLLAFTERYADCVIKAFVEEKTAGFVTPGHEEIELALIKLYQTTGKQKYLELAKFFIDNRGQSERDIRSTEDLAVRQQRQDHLPVRLQTTAEGHAVRAMYLFAAMAALARVDGDETLFSACDTLFRNVTEKRMYITGGLGSSSFGERFTVDYDLPNETAYAESCAALGLVFFCQRMSEYKAVRAYADTAERAMYNGVISGISINGDAFFYNNPLTFDLANIQKNVTLGIPGQPVVTQRQKMFRTCCCPPNLLRFINSVAEYLYTEDGNTLYVHHYMNGVTQHNGITIRQTTEYPAQGTVRLEVGVGYKKIAVRIPGWCTQFTASTAYDEIDGYAYFDASPVIELDFHIRPRFVVSAPGVHANAGRAALMYGPLVYCIEGIDHEGDLFSLSVDVHTAFEITPDSYFKFPGITADGYARVDDGRLYADADSIKYEAQKLKFIPFYAMENRGETDMQVWIPMK